MPRCMHCGCEAHSTPMMDAFFCRACRMFWCVCCTTADASCPTCQGHDVWGFTLTEDAYL